MDLIIIKRNLMPILITLVGLLPLVFGIYQIKNQIRFLANSVVVSGEIIDFNIRSNSSKSRYWQKSIYGPIIEFFDEKGEKKIFEANEYYKKDKHHVGQKIELRISEYYPYKAINDFKALWQDIIFITLTGLIVMLIGYSKFN